MQTQHHLVTASLPGIHLMEIFQIFQEMEMMPPTMIQTSLKIGLGLLEKPFSSMEWMIE